MSLAGAETSLTRFGRVTSALLHVLLQVSRNESHSGVVSINVGVSQGMETSVGGELVAPTWSEEGTIGGLASSESSLERDDTTEDASSRGKSSSRNELGKSFRREAVDAVGATTAAAMAEFMVFLKF